MAGKLVVLPSRIGQGFNWYELVSTTDVFKPIVLDCAKVEQFNSFGSKVFFKDHPPFREKPILSNVPEPMLRDLITWRMFDLPYKLSSICPKFQCENDHDVVECFDLGTESAEHMVNSSPRKCPVCGEDLELVSVDTPEEFFTYFLRFKI